MKRKFDDRFDQSRYEELMATVAAEDRARNALKRRERLEPRDEHASYAAVFALVGAFVVVIVATVWDYWF